MTAFTVAHAKKTLSRLIGPALGGEDVVIICHCRPMVEIRAVRLTDGARALGSAFVDPSHPA